MVFLFQPSSNAFLPAPGTRMPSSSTTRRPTSRAVPVRRQTSMRNEGDSWELAPATGRSTGEKFEYEHLCRTRKPANPTATSDGRANSSGGCTLEETHMEPELELWKLWKTFFFTTQWFSGSMLIFSGCISPECGGWCSFYSRFCGIAIYRVCPKAFTNHRHPL